MSRFFTFFQGTAFWPVLLLGCALHVSAEEVEVRLRLLPPLPESWTPATDGLNYNLLELRKSSVADEEEMLWQARIFSLLLNHHLPAEQDPVFLLDDMTQLAHYFAHYPAVRQLFEDLAGTRWQWRYSLGGAETRVAGTRLRVDSALVLFDPRAGAQLRFQRSCENKVPFCYTAPADVLLHELLHVRAILRNTATFIDQGGLNPYLYPHAHEQHTIAQERQLYADMTVRDRIPRPKRLEHSGRPVSASCATCLR